MNVVEHTWSADSVSSTSSMAPSDRRRESDDRKNRRGLTIDEESVFVCLGEMEMMMMNHCVYRWFKEGNIVGFDLFLLKSDASQIVNHLL